MIRCAVCGLEIDPEPSLPDAVFVNPVIGATSHALTDRKTPFHFHEGQCKSAGWKMLTDALTKYRHECELKGLGHGVAWFEWGNRFVHASEMPSITESMARQLSSPQAMRHRLEEEATWHAVVYVGGFVAFTAFLIGKSLFTPAGAKLSWFGHLIVFGSTFTFLPLGWFSMRLLSACGAQLRWYWHVVVYALWLGLVMLALKVYVFPWLTG